MLQDDQSWTVLRCCAYVWCTPLDAGNIEFGGPIVLRHVIRLFPFCVEAEWYAGGYVNSR